MDRRGFFLTLLAVPVCAWRFLYRGITILCHRWVGHSGPHLGMVTILVEEDLEREAG